MGHDGEPTTGELPTSGEPRAGGELIANGSTEDRFRPREPLPLINDGRQSQLLGELLRGVSRSFYLTLRVLPSSLRLPVGLAYLLARAADTITDTALVSPELRREFILVFRFQVRGPARVDALRRIEAELTDLQTIPKERELLTALPSAFALLEAMPEPDAALVRSVLVTLTLGMEQDLSTFPLESSGNVESLVDAHALDRYIYLVAGCVGEFWTAITMAHAHSLRKWDREAMSQTGVRFGKALQLTNILRDVPKDLRIGRCYLPAVELAQMGLSAQDLLDPEQGKIARPVLVDWIKTALEHYQAAEDYLLAIPRHSPRLRLAVLWPILIGLATLAQLVKNENWLNPAFPTRVSRRWVYMTLVLSLPAVVSNKVLRMWIARLRRQIIEAA